MMEIVIYKTKNGDIALDVNLRDNTLWLTQQQIADLFDTKRQAITKHLKNIFASKELSESSVCSKMERTASDGKKYKTNFYNLDAIISVGYRVNSSQATQFRIWATKILNSHIINGYSFNKQRIQANYAKFENAIEEVKGIVKSTQVDNDAVIELISMFANTWLSLDAYDKDQLSPTGTSKKKATLTADKLSQALQELKKNLISKGEATELFAAERSKESVSGIIGNVMQSFGGEDLYPTIEEKAAHLLYFMVKNHPFADGNKRSGAYAFIWFLKKSKMLDLGNITPAALTAMTLLIAESNPKDKNKMIGLVCKLLNK